MKTTKKYSLKTYSFEKLKTILKNSYQANP